MNNRTIFTTIFFCALMLSNEANANACHAPARQELETKYKNAFGAGSEVTGPKAVSEIEAESLIKISQCTQCPQKPFGYQHAAWAAFKAQLKTDDCIVFFRSDRESWKKLRGFEGYGLIQDGKLTAVIKTIVN